MFEVPSRPKKWLLDSVQFLVPFSSTRMRGAILPIPQVF